MRNVLTLTLLTVAGFTGCQGLGGYSAQSVTRVPPIGTGAYPLPGNGNYYGNAAPAQGTAMLQPNGSTNSTNFEAGTYATTNMQPATSTAQYDFPSTTPVGSGVSTASAVSPVGGADLQWQR